MTLRWERQGPGAGAKRGPSHRRVTQHKGDGREAAAGADLRSPATRNCGYRPPPPHPGPPARSPAGLSVSSLPPYWTARVHSQAPDIWYRSRLGAREQVAAVGQLGRQLGASGQSPVAFVASFCPAARSVLPARARCRPDFAPRRAQLLLLLLLLLRARCLRCRRQPGSRREGRPRPWPNMAEVSIDQSKLPGVKEGRGRVVKRARGPSPLPARVPSCQARRPLGPRGRVAAPTWAGLPWPRRKLD